MNDRRVSVVEVGPRDGLQNEPQPVSTADKLALCQNLIEAGVSRLEAAAFVSPKWVPQMADGLDVLAGLKAWLNTQGQAQRMSLKVALSALVPNQKGMELAVQAGVDEVVVFTAASEAFTQKNINCSIAESIDRFKPVIAQALQAGMHVRGSISCALGCPYEGAVPAAKAAEVAQRLADVGVMEFDVADTIGVGTPGQTRAVFDAVGHAVGLNRVAGHFHDTYGQALANTLAALELGVRTFHSSIGGLGGCPYAKGATGNVATEDLVYMLEGMGYETGLNMAGLIHAGQTIAQALGRPYASRAGRALFAKSAGQ